VIGKMKKIYFLYISLVAFLSIMTVSANAITQSDQNNNLGTLSFLENNNGLANNSKIDNNYTESIPDYVQPGDLIFMDKSDTSFGLLPGIISNDHAAMYVGNNKIIHASSQGVKIWDFEDLVNGPFNAQNIRFGYVKSANASQKKMALEFALKQVGCEYQHEFWRGSIKKNHDPENGFLSDVWYCSELVWAAYYNCNGTIGEGIDIDSNGWNGIQTVLPSEIITDNDVVMYDFILHKSCANFKFCDYIISVLKFLLNR
jgi:hypothetical protein